MSASHEGRPTHGPEHNRKEFWDRMSHFVFEISYESQASEYYMALYDDYLSSRFGTVSPSQDLNPETAEAKWSTAIALHDAICFALQEQKEANVHREFSDTVESAATKLRDETLVEHWRGEREADSEQVLMTISNLEQLFTNEELDDNPTLSFASYRKPQQDTGTDLVLYERALRPGPFSKAGLSAALRLLPRNQG